MVAKWNEPAPFPPTIEDASVVEEVRERVNAYFKASPAMKAKL